MLIPRAIRRSRWMLRQVGILACCAPSIAGALSSLPGKQVRLKPGDDVAQQVATAPEGTTFTFAPGTYRMQSILPRNNDTFVGLGDVILTGAKIITPQKDGAYWSATEARGKWDQLHCEKATPRCYILSDLFIDDQIQKPVSSLAELSTGNWYYDDTAGKLFLSTDPAHHTVEFGSATYAFSGTATGVTIRHMTVEKYANPPQRGAVGGDRNPVGWTVTNVKAVWNHGTGIELGGHAQVQNCFIAHNGQMGVGVHGEDDLIAGNEIAFNNYAGYAAGWEAGGSKFVRTKHLIVRDNYAHDNMGPGLWTDTDNVDTLYENNRLVNNTGSGIHHEISYSAIIRNNVILGNKEGILVANSSNVEVFNNFVEVPADKSGGIRIVNIIRGTGDYGPRLSHDDHVHNNTIVFLGPLGHSGFAGDLTNVTGNLFDFNSYYLVDTGKKHWAWSGMKTLDDMHALGQETHSTMLKARPAPPISPATKVP